jgi:hypothetical protein
MRLTITLDMRRRALRVHAEQALDYPPGHVPGLLAAAVTEAITPPPAADEVELAGLVPTPRTPTQDQAPETGPSPESVDARLRRRVLRALDEGTTVAEAARRFGIDPAQIDRWDDDPAIDAHTDLLGAGPGGHHPARVAS